MMPPREIPLSKLKMIRAMGGSAIFVALGCWMCFFDFADYLEGRTLHDLIPVIGALSISFFGVILIFLVIRSTDKRPGLVVDEHGITDHSSLMSVGLIEWADIEGIRLRETAGQSFVLVILHDPEKYVLAQKSGIKRFFMKMNKRSYGTPVNLSAGLLDIRFRDLFSLLQRASIEQQGK